MLERQRAPDAEADTEAARRVRKKQNKHKRQSKMGRKIKQEPIPMDLHIILTFTETDTQ